MTDSNQKGFQPMLANEWKPCNDPSLYLISEKLDGIRAIWNGECFMSRTNKPIHAPKWFCDALPKDCILDGELHSQRNDFQNISSIVRKKKPIDDEWKKICYCVFDLPMHQGIATDRHFELQKLINNNSSIIKLVDQIEINDAQSLDKHLNHMLSEKCEGLMLKKKDSKYENKRSNNLMKLKKFHDKEAIVVGYNLGQGKYIDKLGALQVKWMFNEKEIHFTVGSGLNDTHRINYETQFPIGTQVKVKYGDLNETGKPRFPVFLGVKDNLEI